MTLIAVVDDDLSILDALQTLIECQGWMVETFSTVQDFFERLSASVVFDCVILDPHLGGPDGDTIASELQARRIPFVGLTARPDSEVTEKVAAMGAFAIMTKPASTAELVENIRRGIYRPRDKQA